MKKMLLNTETYISQWSSNNFTYWDKKTETNLVSVFFVVKSTGY